MGKRTHAWVARPKLEPHPTEPRFLRTVHGDGYSLTVDRS